MAMEHWHIDASHSSLHFTARHLVIARVHGQFTRWSGSIAVTDGDLRGAEVQVLIDVSTVDTGVADRDAHLKSADFFDTARFPFASFVATRFDPADDGSGGRLAGTLTIKDQSRPVVLRVEQHGRMTDPWRNERAAFTARTTIDRHSFGLGWNQVLACGGLLVGEQVDLEIDIEAVRQPATRVA